MDKEALVQQYLGLGWVILPTRKDRPKAPVATDWPNAEAVTDPEGFEHGIYLVCGERSGVDVIDLDDDTHADAFASLAAGKTPIARTPKGGFHIFVAHDPVLQWTNRVRAVEGVDIRTTGGGVVLPSGGSDRTWNFGAEPWVQPFSIATARFHELLNDLGDGGDVFPKGGSDLTELLRSNPAEGTRSQILTSIAGHLSPMVEYEDAFEALLQAINRGWSDPLPRKSVRDTSSMWKRDRAKQKELEEKQQGNPWWVQNGDLWLPKGRDGVVWLSPVPEVVAKRTTAEGEPSWELHNAGRKVVVKPADLHHRGGKMSIALANISVLHYPAATGQTPPGNLLNQWLDSQVIEEVVEAPHWGWNDGIGWVGIEPDAVGPSEEPLIGWEDRPDIIEQIPTWQESEVAAVFCSWVALQAVKGKVVTDFEPNVVLHGSAGSGKTRGLFAFACRLTGSKRTAVSTNAVLRDRLATHRNGIVVVDDHTGAVGDSQLMELYRLSTSSESRSKKRQEASGNWVSDEIPLVGSMVISGEAVGDLAQDRALFDRSIVLEVPEAKQRQSLIHEGRSQWDDIKEACRSLGAPDESAAHALAGPFVRRMLGAVDDLGVPSFDSGDRAEIKRQLVQYGAQLWQHAYPGSACEDGRMVSEAVDAWAERERSYDPSMSLTLVTKILPYYLVNEEWRWLPFIKIGAEGIISYHVAGLASKWQQDHGRSPRDLELGSEGNIRRESALLAKAGLAESSDRQRLVPGGSPVRCVTLSRVLSRSILTSLGIYEGDDDDISDRLLSAELLDHLKT